HVDVHARRGQLAELNERRVADRLENVVETGHRFLLEGVALADHPRGGAWQRPWKRAWFFVPGTLDSGPRPSERGPRLGPATVWCRESPALQFASWPRSSSSSSGGSKSCATARASSCPRPRKRGR